MHVIVSVDVYIFENIIMTDMMTVIVILLQYFYFNGQYKKRSSLVSTR